MTVRELKALLRDWPEVYDDGTETEVWIETGHELSSLVIEGVPLNRWKSGTSDVLLASAAFREE